MGTAAGIYFDGKRMSVAILEDNLQAKQFLFLENVETEKEKLFSLIKLEKLENIPVTIGVPARNAILRKFNVPFVDIEQINQTILYKSEEHILAFPIESVIVDYHILSVNGQETRVLMGAILRDYLAKTLHTLGEYKIFPVAVDLDIFSLFYLAQNFYLQSNLQHKHLAIADITFEGANLLILSDGKIIDARSIQIKVGSAMAAVMTNMYETAELAIVNPEKMQNIPASMETNKENLARLVKEIKRSLFAYDFVEAIYFCGAPELTNELQRMAAQELKIPVLPFSIAPLVQKNAQFPQEEQGLHVAVGLALKSLEKTSGGFNFRKEAYAFAKSFDIIKKSLFIMLALLSVLFFLGGLYFFREKRAKEKVYNNLIYKTNVVYNRVNPKESLDKVSYWQKIYTTRRFLERSIEEASLQKIVSPDLCNIWATLFAHIAQVRKEFYFTVDEVMFDHKEISFEGKSDDLIFLDSLRNLLQKEEFVAPTAGFKVVAKEPIRNPGEGADVKLTHRYKIVVKLRASSQ